MYSIRQHIELFHLLFLEQLSQKLDKKLYCLKGGCNLRFFLKSIRYSEDIDLDIQVISKTTLQNKISNLLKGNTFNQILQLKGLSISHISEPKQTETTQRWKIQLHTRSSNLPFNTKIEFSRRDNIQGAILEILDKKLIKDYHLAPLYINHYPAEIAFIQKIRALILRSQTQARDIFDIFHLMNYVENLPLPNDVMDQINIAKQNAFSINFGEFKSQVVAYLLPEYQTLYNDESIWDNMILKITEYFDALS